MHQLHLLRHAKSGSDEGVDDRDRNLSKQGREAARRVGLHLPAALGPVDLVLCSSALRTRETAELVLAGFAPRPPIAFEDGLYLASRALLLRRLCALDERVGSVLVIGHNPGLHELAIALADAQSPHYRDLATGKFPPAVRASFAVDGAWARLAAGSHRLVDYVTAKSLND